MSTGRCYTKCPDGYVLDGAVCRPSAPSTGKPVIAAAETTPYQLEPLITDPQTQRVGMCAGTRHACIASDTGASPVDCLGGAPCQEVRQGGGGGSCTTRTAPSGDEVLSFVMVVLFAILLVVLVVSLILDICRPRRVVYLPESYRHQ